MVRRRWRARGFPVCMNSVWRARGSLVCISSSMESTLFPGSPHMRIMVRSHDMVDP